MSSFFDEELSVIERQEMAEKLLTIPRPAVFSAGKPSFSVKLVAGDVAPSLGVFMSEKKLASLPYTGSEW